jgi:hypothetical protein
LAVNTTPLVSGTMFLGAAEPFKPFGTKSKPRDNCENTFGFSMGKPRNMTAPCDNMSCNSVSLLASIHDGISAAVRSVEAGVRTKGKSRPSTLAIFCPGIFTAWKLPNHELSSNEKEKGVKMKIRMLRTFIDKGKMLKYAPRE